MNIPSIQDADTARHITRVTINISNIVNMLHELHGDIGSPTMLRNEVAQILEVYNELGQMLDHLNEHVNKPH